MHTPGQWCVHGLLLFYAACSLGALVNVSFAGFLHNAGLAWLAGICGLAITSVRNYAVNTDLTWRRDRPV